MKKNLIAILLLVASSTGSAQTKVNNKDFYLQKSKHQKTAAWIMVGGGAALVAGGTIIYASGIQGNKLNSLLNAFNPTGPAMIALGAASMVGSIPLFIAASRNKYQSLSLTLKNEPSLQLQKNSFVIHSIPSLTLKMSL